MYLLGVAYSKAGQLKAGKELFDKMLTDASTKAQANFLLVRVTDSALSASALVQTLAKENILVRACADFPGLGKGFFRVAVRTRPENCRLLTALRVLLK